MNRKWVVYTLRDDEIDKFLAVALSEEEASEKAGKWWKSFDSGEKAKPKGYTGISWKPVSNFDQWNAPEEM